MGRRRITPGTLVPMAAAVLLAAGPHPLAAQSTDDAGGRQAGSAKASSASADRHPVARLEGEISVDGRLDEPAWERADAIRLPWESSPGRNAEAPVATTCRAVQDREHLYLGCRARDPEPGEVRARLADRDEPRDDDWIRFLLDPFGDRRRAFDFRVNPLGVQMDALFRQGVPDFAWDGIWHSDGRLTDRGYVVEVAIPFRSLNFPGSEEAQDWGIIVSRSRPRDVIRRIRSVKTDYDDQCLLCQAETLAGLRPRVSGRGVELVPTFTTTRTDSLVADGDAPALAAGRVSSGDVEPQVGFNGSWRLGSSLQVSATVNPDFSQVEADRARLASNQRFPLFFPEKRPFFQERSDLFRTQMNLIFTRQIADPVAGLKLTGKQGANAVGAFLARDRVTRLILPGATGSRRTVLDRGNTAFVGRWERDVGESSSLGLVATAREGEGYHNRMAAVDGRLQLGSSTELRWALAGSDTEYPEEVAGTAGQPEGDFAGYAANLFLQHRTRAWTAWLFARDRSPDFRADAGFTSRVDTRRLSGGVVRTFWTPDLPWATAFWVTLNPRRIQDHDGEALDQGGTARATWSGPLQSRLTARWSWRERRFGGRLFTVPTWGLSASVRPSGKLTLAADVTTGRQIDFLNVREADLFRLRPGVDWRVGRHLSLSLSHDLERLSRSGSGFQEENVTELRARWHFSREAFLRTILQHRVVDRDPAAFGADLPSEDRGLFGQFLFSYELNPRTALFVGYTDDRQGVEQDPLDVDLRQTERTFFTKFSYSWRF